MHKKFKKFLAGLLSATLIAGSVQAMPLVAMAAEDAINPGSQITAQFATPAVDGEIEEAWDAAQAYNLTKPNTRSDTSATAKLLWDDTTLYVLFEVTDGNLDKTNSANYQQDSVEVFMDELNNGGNSYGSDDVHYRVNYDNQKSTDAGAASRWNTAVKVVEGGYVAEVAVDFDSIQPANDTVIAFDGQVNCCSGGTRQGTISLFDTTGNAYQNPSLLGKVVLAGRPDDLPAIANPKALKAVISKANNMHVDNNSPELVEAFNTAVADAQNLIDGGEYTAEDLDAAQAVLEAAIAAIEEENANNTRMKAKYGTPVIDGDMSDELWSSAYTYYTSKDNKGQYAEIKTLWDEAALYALVKVYDPTYDVAGSDAHTKDSVEFFFFETADSKNNSFGKDGGQWRINRANVTTVTFGSNEAFYGKLTEMEGGYFVEARLNIADSMPVEPGYVMNFDIAVNLCENGGRTSAVAWTSGDCYSNPRTAGELIFLETSAGESKVPNGYNPYALMKVLDKALAMDAADYDAASFEANYDKAKLEQYRAEALSGTLDDATISAYYNAVIKMMSGITYDGVHKSALGFEADHNLPDPFTFENGSKVKTAEDWTLRHDEIQELYEFYMYGKLPKAEETGLKKTFSESNGTYTVSLSREYEGKTLTGSFTFKVDFPQGENPRDEKGWPYIINYGGNVSGAQNAGYAVVEYSNNGNVASNNSYYNGVFYTMYPECKGNDYVNGVGPLAARAWGVGLIIDCIEAEVGDLGRLNPANSVVSGFSYLGKNALVTGVLEDRIAVTNPQHSGIGGAAMLRYSSQGKVYDTATYGISHLVDRTEPMGQVQGQGMAWVKTIFADFIGADSTPMDTHELLSLVAPRGLIVSAGWQDNGTDPEGMYASYINAKEVYKFLGAEENIAYANFPTAHASSTAETNKIFAFCDHYFYGDEVADDFYATVYDNSPDQADYYQIRMPEIVETSDVPYASAIIDGSDKEWADAYVLEAKNVITPDVEAGTDGDAEIKVMWDDAYLYLKAKVTDSDVLADVSKGENADSITVTIGANNEEGTAVKNYLLSADGNIRSIKRGQNSTYSETAGSYAKAIETADGYEVEAAITWAELGIEAGAGASLAIEAVVNSCSTASGKLDYKKAVELTEYPENIVEERVTSWWSTTIVRYNVGPVAQDLIALTLGAKNTSDVAEDIGRYDLVKYCKTFYDTKVAPYPKKDSYDESKVTAAQAEAIAPAATKESIAAAKKALEDMAAVIYAENCEGRMMAQYGTPVIDGDMSDELWDSAYSYYTGKDNKGQYAEIKTLWDEEALYALVKVYDPTYDVTGSDAHTKDSVEFFFLEHADALNNSFGRDGGQWRINRANVITVTFGANEPFYGKLTEMEGGYFVEARLNFADSMPVAPDYIMNFDIAVNLCENGGRTSAVAWTSGDCYSNPKTAGEIIFLDESAGESKVPNGYNPYSLMKVLDKALVMDVADYDADSFNANYDKAKLEQFKTKALSGKATDAEIKAMYDEVIAMLSKITYDGVHKTALGFVENHDLPDPFTFEDGTPVNNEMDWELRHDEIQDLFEFYMYGKLPKPEETGLTEEFSVSEDGQTYTITLSREYNGETLTGSFNFKVDFPEGENPKDEEGWPYFINYGGNISGAQAAGYAVVEYNSNGNVASNNSYYNGVFYTLYPECKGNDYVNGVGPLAARAWGVGRIIDCIESGIGQLDRLNPANSIVTGFSYLGKNALVTGVLEDRIAITNPQHSGIGGAAMLRYSSQGKVYDEETYGINYLVTKTEPMGQVQGQGMAWVKTIFADFIGADSTPFDIHMLMSLVAPRGLIVSAGWQDNGTDPEGMFASYINAKEVYKYLDAEDNIAYVNFPTGHASSTAETQSIFDFADFYFYGEELPEGFRNTVYDNSPDKDIYYQISAPEKVYPTPVPPVEDDDDDDDDDAAVIAPVGTPAPVVKPVSPKTGESRTAAAAAATLFAAAMAAAYLAMKSRREEQA